MSGGVYRPGPADEDGSGLVGSSRSIEFVRERVRRAALPGLVAFVSGEAGSGRREVARAIHRAGRDAARPLVVIDCDARFQLDLNSVLFGTGTTGAPGLLESPDAGTVYLASVDEAPLPVQRKLLRAIEDNVFVASDPVHPRPVTVRLLAGAGPGHRDAVRAGRFDRELWERLSLFEIEVPPLRERSGDLPDLVTHLVGRLSRKIGRLAPAVDLEARAALLRRPWLGNVRELRNVLEQALVLLEGSVLRESDLPPAVPVRVSAGLEDLKAARRAFERDHIERILVRYGGDKETAAQALGVDVTTLYRKLAAPAS